MIRAILLSSLLLLTTSCATQIGVVENPDGTSQKGIYVSLGDTTGPAGMKGGVISVPGAMLIGNVFRYVGEFASSVFGRPVIVSPVDQD